MQVQRIVCTSDKERQISV